MNRRRFFSDPRTAAALLVMALVVQSDGLAETESGYEASLSAWRAERMAILKGPDGYLNLAGLYWLQPGDNSFGGHRDNDLVFPSAPAKLGVFALKEDGVSMRIVTGQSVLVEGQPVTEIFLADDTTGRPVTASFESLSWSIIKRDGRFAVRLHDRASSALETLQSIPRFPVAREWRLTGVMRRYSEPQVAQMATVIEGLGWSPVSPGVVEFAIDGELKSLQAYRSGGGLLFVFADLTSGRETYPAGRFLYTDAPDAHGQVVLDFNKAENPPCAFNDFSTCPVASPRNRIDAAITAGEKFDPGLHIGSSSISPRQEAQ